MITKTPAFQTSDNKTFPSLDEAQRHEIALTLHLDPGAPPEKQLLDAIMSAREKIADILTTKPNSRPKARKANKKGAVKPTETPKA